jgi:glycosyltransferase involved in cell wall biosynthesis
MGGGERHLADLANSLVQKGHTVFAAIAPGSPLRSELALLPEKNILELPMRNSLDVFAAFKLAQIVRTFEIDVIHAHVARDYVLAAAASRLSGNTPYILTRHVLFPLKKLHRTTLGRASRIIAVSEAVAEGLRKQGLFDPRKIVTIHNGIDIKRFAQKSSDQVRSAKDDGARRPYIVGMIGHIAPIKGQEDLLRAAAIIVAQRGDVEFVMVGEDKSRRYENRTATEGLIKQLKLVSKVRMLGWQDDVSDLLSTFDVFISPSRSEPFGLVILEAMASGVPIVATRSEGAIEILEDGLTGMLVPIGDSTVLAETIMNFLDAPDDRAQLSSNARRAVDERFSLFKMVEATERAYTETIVPSSSQ